MSQKVPQYRRASNGQAFVQHKSILTPSHRMYLGKHGTPTSRKKYQQFLAKLNVAEGTEISLHSEFDHTIYELAAGYLEYAESYYVKDGKPTSELACTAYAIAPLVELFGEDEGRNFGPRDLMVY